MEWTVEFHDAFRSEWLGLPSEVRVEMSALFAYLRTEGPQLGRPDVDTLDGSRHANMKELRLRVQRTPWRFAFAFDPKRNAIVLCGGEKSGMSQRLFYRRLLDLADRRYDDHLKRLENKNG